MKCLGVLAIIALAFVCLPADGAESDVIRVFDPELKLSKEEMLNILKEASLEKFGFKKTVESTIETNENGEKSMKETIFYMATAKCSEAAYWEGVLEERLHADFRSSKFGRKFVREIQSRIKGRGTKYCKIGLEMHLIHLHRCCQDSAMVSNVVKREVRSEKGGHWSCRCAKIVYLDYIA